MAHIFIPPKQDATVFSRQSRVYQNSGRDEILQIEKTYQDLDLIGGSMVNPPVPAVARTLIQFDLTDITEQIQSGSIPNPRFYLNLKTVEAKEIPLSYSISAYPVSQSWTMGAGRTYDGFTTDGVSWKMRNGINGGAGMLWYHNTTSQQGVAVATNWTGCLSGSWSGSWYGSGTGSFSGTFTGSYSGSFSGVSSSYFPSSGTYFSGSVTGSFTGFISGHFSGSGVFAFTSHSIEYPCYEFSSILQQGDFETEGDLLFEDENMIDLLGEEYSISSSCISQDTSLYDISGGGTWYLDEIDSIKGGCLVNLQSPDCSYIEQTGSQYSSSINTASFCYSGCCSGSYEATQSFNYETSDIHMDVTNIVQAWVCGCIPNNGFILMHSNECDNNDYGQLRFFSMDTNTIYVPSLECAWDDSIFIPTSSVATPLTDNNKVVYVSNIRPVYKHGSIVKLEVFGRPTYPERTFNRYSDYLAPEYLPETSYYSIVDAETNEVWIDFDKNSSKISCDVSGSNYFMLNTCGLPQERYFRVRLKIEQSGSVDYFEDKATFKISR